MHDAHMTLSAPQELTVAQRLYAANPELYKERQRRYKAANPDRVKATKKAYYERNRESILAQRRAAKESGDTRARETHLKRTYGITLQEYDNLLAGQRGKCAGCGSSTPKDSRCTYFHVDHDHTTGAVRGLLCKPCNNSLGYLEDNPSTLRSLATYLEAHARPTSEG